MIRNAIAATLALLVGLSAPGPGFAGRAAQPGPRTHASRSHAGRAQHAPGPRRPAGSPEERAIAGLHAAGEARVEALMRATRSWHDPALVRARDHRVAEMRRESAVRELEARAAWARRRGDRARAHEYDRERLAVALPASRPMR